METEIKIDGKIVIAKIIEQIGSNLIIQIDNRKYNLDIEEVRNDIYSIIHKGKSHNIQLSSFGNGKSYTANTYYNSYNIDIIDAQTKYLENRKKATGVDNQNTIICPMPGKVVKILVDQGVKVDKGETIIIVEAMKMQSEYKASVKSVVSKILVNENDTVNGGQVMIELTPIQN